MQCYKVSAQAYRIVYVYLCHKNHWRRSQRRIWVSHSRCRNVACRSNLWRTTEFANLDRVNSGDLR